MHTLLTAEHKDSKVRSEGLELPKALQALKPTSKSCLLLRKTAGNRIQIEQDRYSRSNGKRRSK